MNNRSKGLPLTRSHVEQIFPKLTPAQIRRIATHGHMRAMQRGEVLSSKEIAPYRSLLWSQASSRLCALLAPLRPLSQSIDLVSSLARSARSPAGGLFRVRATKPGKGD